MTLAIKEFILLLLIDGSQSQEPNFSSCGDCSVLFSTSFFTGLLSLSPRAPSVFISSGEGIAVHSGILKMRGHGRTMLCLAVGVGFKKTHLSHH